MPEQFIPTVLCPRCARHMFLSEIQPDPLEDDRESMFFTCQCDFEYRLSATAYAERAM